MNIDLGETYIVKVEISSSTTITGFRGSAAARMAVQPKKNQQT